MREDTMTCSDVSELEEECEDDEAEMDNDNNRLEGKMNDFMMHDNYDDPDDNYGKHDDDNQSDDEDNQHDTDDIHEDVNVYDDDEDGNMYDDYEDVNMYDNDEDNNLYANNNDAMDIEENDSVEPDMKCSGFKIVIDNLDKHVKPQYMRLNNQARSLNYINSFAVKDRIDSSSLSSYKHSFDMSVNFSDILPSTATQPTLQKSKCNHFSYFSAAHGCF